MDEDGQQLLITLVAKMDRYENQILKAKGLTASTFADMENRAKKAGSNIAKGIGDGAKLTNSQMMALQHAARSMIEQISLGVSPFQALTAQMSHLSYIASGPGGPAAAFKALGTTALSIATRFPVATAAVVAAGAAFATYKALTGKDIESLDQLLKEHENNIKRLGSAYDQVRGKEQKYAADTARTVNALNESSAEKVKSKLTGQVQSVLDQIAEITGSGPGPHNDRQIAMASVYQPFQAAIDKLAESARAGTPDVKAFRDEVSKIAEADPSHLNGTRDFLLSISKDAADTAAALPEVTQKISAVDEAFTALQSAIDDVKSDSARQQLQKLLDQAKDGKVGLDDVASALGTLSGTNLDLAGPIGELGKLFSAAIKARDAVSNAVKLTNNLGQLGPVYSDNGSFEDEGGYENSKADATKSQTQIAAEKAAKHHRGGSGTKTDDYQREIQQITQRTSVLNAEAAAQASVNPLINDYGEAVEEAKTRQELLNAAQKAGLQITPQLQAQIDATAKAYAQADAGNKKVADDQKKIKEQQQQLIETEKQFVGGLAHDLLDGVSPAQALSNALKRLASTLLDDVLNAIFKVKQAGGGSGGGGGLFGFLGNLFGLGGLSPAAQAAVGAGTGGLYADGGYTGHGGKYQPAGIVHRGEYVFDQASVRAAGGPAVLDAMRNGLKGYADGGYVGSAPAVRTPTMPTGQGGSQPIQINAPVTVNGSAGTPSQNQDLANKMQKQMEATMRGVVVDELRRQMRPGNLLNNRAL